MKLFYHLIYEWNKGVRDLVLFTSCNKDAKKITDILQKRKIPFLCNKIDEDKFNIFFGKSDCIEIVKGFSSENLNEINDYEDFLLGIMLGYSKSQQYKRFLERKNKNYLQLTNFL